MVSFDLNKFHHKQDGYINVENSDTHFFSKIVQLITGENSCFLRGTETDVSPVVQSGSGR